MNEHEKHFLDALQKRMQSVSEEERLFNSRMEELKRLTGGDVMFAGPNARQNLIDALWEARKIHAPDVYAAAVKRQEDAEREKRERSMARHAEKMPSMTRAEMRKWKFRWKTLEELRTTHSKCIRSSDSNAICRGCKRHVCDHKEMRDTICTSVPVCHMCDTFVAPNPYNPRNEGLLKMWKAGRKRSRSECSEDEEGPPAKRDCVRVKDD